MPAGAEVYLAWNISVASGSSPNLAMGLALDDVSISATFEGEENLCAGCGVVTLSISYYDIGYATGLMAYEILINGAEVSEMPIEYAPEFVKEYNADLCAALGITVPEDYVAIGADEAEAA